MRHEGECDINRHLEAKLRTVSPSPSGFSPGQDLGFELPRPLGILLVSFITQFSYPQEELANFCTVPFHSDRVGGIRKRTVAKPKKYLGPKVDEYEYGVERGSDEGGCSRKKELSDLKFGRYGKDGG